MFPKLKQAKLALCEHLLNFLFSFINLLMFGPRYVVSYPRALIMPKVHSSRFQSLMHLFRGSSLHILGLLVLTPLASIHVCSSSMRSILFHLISFLFELPQGKCGRFWVSYITPGFSNSTYHLITLDISSEKMARWICDSYKNTS